jgi:hypothetical protein
MYVSCCVVVVMNVDDRMNATFASSFASSHLSKELGVNECSPTLGFDNRREF